MKTILAKLANRLYDHTPASHRAMYGVYKAGQIVLNAVFLAELVRPGMTVLDIGANIGFYTVVPRKAGGADGPRDRF